MLSLFSPIDRFLNGITMYRLVLYVLTCLSAVAIVLSSLGFLAYGPLPLIASLLILVAVSWSANELLARVLRVPSNTESSYITAFILFLVMMPPSSLIEAGFLALAGAVGVASKYLLAWGRQHVLNPAALAAVVVGIPTGLALWWVGTALLLPFTLVGSLLIVRKTRRFGLFLATVGAGALTATALALWSDAALLPSLAQFFLSWPIVFFAGVMVTEPFTAPGTSRGRLLYGAAAGILSNWPFHVGPVFSTPEMSLLLVNLAAFPFSLRRRLVLTLARREEIARDTYAFHFSTPSQPDYRAGQYLEWTLPHDSADQRGLRRYFTIASSPTEEGLQIGVKFAPDGSSFKKRLLELEPGARMYAAIRGGDFVLPDDKSEKLAFIAGGIGVTPFRSMIRQLVDTKDARDVALFYASKTWGEVAYRPLLGEAERAIGLRTVYVLNDAAGAEGVFEQGFIDAAMLARHVPDFRERTFYLSGPDAMVQAYKKLLHGLGVRRVRTDYFPGF